MAEKKEYVKLWISYGSYFENYSDEEVGRLVRAMMKYRETQEDPGFTGVERFVWPAIKRDIDESLQAQEAAVAASRENGKKGGRPPKAKKPSGRPDNQDNQGGISGDGENPENQVGFDETQKSYGQGQGQGQGQEGAPAPTNAAAEVQADYLNRVNAMASQSCLDELATYANAMGTAVCKMAFDISLDSKKTSWSYIRAILRDKLSAGVKCLADWEALDKKRENDKAAGIPPGKKQPNYMPTADRIQEQSKWLDEFLADQGQSG